MDIIIGNLFSLLAMVSDSLSSSQKTTKRMLLVQQFSQFFYAACAIVLKGYSAVVQNAISFLRNIAAIKQINSRVLEWVLSILGVVLGLVFNNLGIMGLLPIIANLEYTLSVFRFKDDKRALKIAFLLNALLFAVFNAVILNFVGVVSNIIIIVSTVIFLVRDSKSAKTPKTAQ